MPVLFGQGPADVLRKQRSSEPQKRFWDRIKKPRGPQIETNCCLKLGLALAVVATPREDLELLSAGRVSTNSHSLFANFTECSIMLF